MHNEKRIPRARCFALKRIDGGFVSICRLNDRAYRKLVVAECSDKNAR